MLQASKLNPKNYLKRKGKSNLYLTKIFVLFLFCQKNKNKGKKCCQYKEWTGIQEEQELLKGKKEESTLHIVFELISCNNKKIGVQKSKKNMYIKEMQ